MEDESSTWNKHAAGTQEAVNTEAKAMLSQTDAATNNLKTALVTATVVCSLKNRD